jgi:hypothetical protein
MWKKVFEAYIRYNPSIRVEELRKISKALISIVGVPAEVGYRLGNLFGSSIMTERQAQVDIIFRTQYSQINIHLNLGRRFVAYSI